MNAPDVLALCDEYDLTSLNRIPLALGLLSGRGTPNTQLPEHDWRSKFFRVPKFLLEFPCV